MLIRVSVSPLHPSGSRWRAGLHFTREARLVDVDMDQHLSISADEYLVCEVVDGPVPTSETIAAPTTEIGAAPSTGVAEALTGAIRRATKRKR